MGLTCMEQHILSPWPCLVIPHRCLTLDTFTGPDPDSHTCTDVTARSWPLTVVILMGHLGAVYDYDHSKHSALLVWVLWDYAHP